MNQSPRGVSALIGTSGIDLKRTCLLMTQSGHSQLKQNLRLFSAFAFPLPSHLRRLYSSAKVAGSTGHLGNVR
jgi:hypothetical protein